MVAFVDCGAVDNVLPKSVLVFSGGDFQVAEISFFSKERKGHTSSTMGSDFFRVKTSAGSNINTTLEDADVRQPLIPASRLLLFRLRKRLACSSYDCVFRTVFPDRAEHKSHHEKKVCNFTL